MLYAVAVCLDHVAGQILQVRPLLDEASRPCAHILETVMQGQIPLVLDHRQLCVGDVCCVVGIVKADVVNALAGGLTANG